MFLKSLFSLSRFAFGIGFVMMAVIFVVMCVSYRDRRKIKRKNIYRVFFVAVPLTNVIISIILFINIVLPGVIFEEWSDFILGIVIFCFGTIFSIWTHDFFKLVKTLDTNA